MLFIQQENPKREKLLLLLKKHGPMTIDKLGEAMNMHSMSIRQHLLFLEKRDLIDYFTQNKGIGRPAFFYKLTKKAEELFPKAYDQFTIDVFKNIEKYEGYKKIQEILKWRQDRLLKQAKEVLSTKNSLHDKVYGLKEFLEKEGNSLEVITNGKYKLEFNNCSIYKLAVEYNDICQYELQMIKELLEQEVKLEATKAKGNLFCTFILHF